MILKNTQTNTTEEGERESKKNLKIICIVLVILRLQEEYLF